MNAKRTAVLFVVAGAMAVWLAAESRSIAPRREPAALVPPRTADASSEDLAAEIARLRESLRPSAAPREPSRNLFRFGAAPTMAPAAAAAPAAPEEPAAAPPRAAPPPLKLVGLAADPGPDGPVRTAIISGFGELFLVKVGDQVTLRYRVARIAENAVELTALDDGTTLRLALK